VVSRSAATRIDKGSTTWVPAPTSEPRADGGPKLWAVARRKRVRERGWIANPRWAGLAVFDIGVNPAGEA
jgi:hypothetical protein